MPFLYNSICQQGNLSQSKMYKYAATSKLLSHVLVMEVPADNNTE